jgi:hypothetical protein
VSLKIKRKISDVSPYFLTHKLLRMKLPYTSSSVTAVTYVDNAIRLYVDQISLHAIDMILFTTLDRCLLCMIKICRQQILKCWI